MQRFFHIVRDFIDLPEAMWFGWTFQVYSSTETYDFNPVGSAIEQSHLDS